MSLYRQNLQFIYVSYLSARSELFSPDRIQENFEFRDIPLQSLHDILNNDYYVDIAHSTVIFFNLFNKHFQISRVASTSNVI